MSLIRITAGLALLGLGVIIIFYSLYSSYNIFTAKNPPPAVFQMEAKTSIARGEGSQDLQAQLQNMLAEQLKGLLPADSLPTLLNLASWSIFAGILIFGGGQIAGLGVKLLK